MAPDRAQLALFVGGLRDMIDRADHARVMRRPLAGCIAGKSVPRHVRDGNAVERATEPGYDSSAKSQSSTIAARRSASVLTSASASEPAWQAADRDRSHGARSDRSSMPSFDRTQRSQRHAGQRSELVRRKARTQPRTASRPQATAGWTPRMAQDSRGTRMRSAATKQQLHHGCDRSPKPLHGARQRLRRRVRD